MFINNINPVLLNIGPFGIRYYGLVYALGFLLGYLVLRRYVRNGKIKLTEDQMDVYFTWLIIGSIIISRIFEVFIYNPSYYFSHASEMIKIWNGGLSFQGGIVGAVIITLIFVKKYKVHFYDIADILIIPTTLVLAFGKLANYTNSELYGTRTNVPWCVIFEKIDQACRHPVQIYEFILYVALFFGLIWLYKHKDSFKRILSKGLVFWTFVAAYSIIRFFIAFLRDEPLYWGLNMGQWLSLATLAVIGIVLWSSKSKNI